MRTPQSAAAVMAAGGQLLLDEQQVLAQYERQRAEDWARDNGGAWAFMLETARKEIKAGRRFSARHLAEAVRAKDYSDVNGNRTVLSNDIVPALARLIIEAYPEGTRLLIRKKARCDAAFSGDRR